MSQATATGAASGFLEAARQEFQAAVSIAWELEQLAALGVKPGATLIDVGCSAADHARRLREAGLRVVGIDRGESRAIAERRLDRFIQGDVTQAATWEGLSADVAWARLLLRHVGPAAPAVVAHMAQAAPLVVLVTALPNTMEGATGQLAQALAMLAQLGVPDSGALLRDAGLEVVHQSEFTWTSGCRSDRAAMRFLALPLSDALPGRVPTLDGDVIARDMDRWLADGGPGTFRLGLCAGRRR